MSSKLQLHDVVALLDEVPAMHSETGKPLILRRGQIGTTVLLLDRGMWEVEFADREGRAYAILPIAEDQLMPLRDAPEFAAA